jgi:hypothetical protein
MGWLPRFRGYMFRRSVNLECHLRAIGRVVKQDRIERRRGTKSRHRSYQSKVEQNAEFSTTTSITLQHSVLIRSRPNGPRDWQDLTAISEINVTQWNKSLRIE